MRVKRPGANGNRGETTQILLNPDTVYRKTYIMYMAQLPIHLSFLSIKYNAHHPMTIFIIAVFVLITKSQFIYGGQK